MARGGRIVVAGAGAIGSAIAVTLARAGWRVTVVDPAPIGANASGVAAGMLAPVFESLFDAAPSDRYALLVAARELGPSFRILEPRQARSLAPGLEPGLWAVLTPEDWRLDPREALAALRRAGEGLGVRFVRGRLVAAEGGQARLEGQPTPLAADVVVLATGAAQAPDIAPELAALTPIKGHSLRSSEPWRADVTIRGRGVYLCPAGAGVVLGASMEPGQADLAVDASVVQALLASAERLAPGLGGRAWRAKTGVRAATPDGLPLVGFSRAEGVILAVGARRNGWLLVPLIAGAVLDLVEGRPVSGPAARFGADRY